MVKQVIDPPLRRPSATRKGRTEPLDRWRLCRRSGPDDGWHMSDGVTMHHAGVPGSPRMTVPDPHDTRCAYGRLLRRVHTRSWPTGADFFHEAVSLTDGGRHGISTSWLEWRTSPDCRSDRSRRDRGPRWDLERGRHAAVSRSGAHDRGARS